jgi:hypothetical protein
MSNLNKCIESSMSRTMKKSGKISMKRVITEHRRNPSYIIKEKDKSICKEKERECDVCRCINHRHILTKLEEKNQRIIGTIKKL